jgi:hypothetical protein
MIRQPAIVFGDEDMTRPEIEIGDSRIAYFRRKSPDACAFWAERAATLRALTPPLMLHPSSPMQP